MVGSEDTVVPVDGSDTGPLPFVTPTTSDVYRYVDEQDSAAGAMVATAPLPLLPHSPFRGPAWKEFAM